MQTNKCRIFHNGTSDIFYSNNTYWTRSAKAAHARFNLTEINPEDQLPITSSSSIFKSDDAA